MAEYCLFKIFLGVGRRSIGINHGNGWDARVFGVCVLKHGFERGERVSCGTTPETSIKLTIVHQHNHTGDAQCL